MRTMPLYESRGQQLMAWMGGARFLAVSLADQAVAIHGSKVRDRCPASRDCAAEARRRDGGAGAGLTRSIAGLPCVPRAARSSDPSENTGFRRCHMRRSCAKLLPAHFSVAAQAGNSLGVAVLMVYT